MKLYVPDNSALNDLVAPAAATARHRLLDEVSADRVLVLGTAPLLLEMSQTCAVDRPKHLAMLDLFGRISRGSMLMADPPTRRELELRARGALEYPAFVETGYAPTHDPRAVRGGGPYPADHVARLRKEEAEKAFNTKRGLDEVERLAAVAQGHAFDGKRPAWRSTLKRAFADDAYAIELAEYYARTAMVEYGRPLGIATDDLAPRSLPTFWSSALIHVARIRAVVVAGTSPTGKKSPGQMDLIHLEEAASYGDVFVTSDDRLRAFARTVVGLACRVISFTEWVAELTN